MLYATWLRGKEPFRWRIVDLYGEGFRLELLELDDPGTKYLWRVRQVCGVFPAQEEARAHAEQIMASQGV
jgi:hypothetical protein